MAQYMVKVYDASFVQDYTEEGCLTFDNRESAIDYAIELTKDFIDNYIDYLEADVFIKTLGCGDYQMVGYVSYAMNTWDCDGYDKIGYDSIEFEECFN